MLLSHDSLRIVMYVVAVTMCENKQTSMHALKGTQSMKAK